MLVGDREMNMSFAVRGCIECALHEVFFHWSTWSLGILVEEQESFWQLAVVQTFSLQHVGSDGLIVTVCNQLLDTFALVLLAGSIECIVESEFLNLVEVLLLEVCGGHIVISINESEHVFEHSTGGTRCGYKLHDFVACSFVLVPYLLELLALVSIGGNDATPDTCCSLKFQEGKSSLKLI